MTTIGSVLLTMWTSCMLPSEASLPADTLRTARQLQQVDVRAGRTTAEEYVGSPTQRMDARTLQERGVSSLTDALQRFSGTNVRDYGGAGGLKTVSVHGMGAGHTVVTLNGLSLGDHRSGQVDLARYNDVSALTEVSLTTADQLSLLCPVRNLGGALLNLQTDATPDSAGHHVKVAVSGGSFGTVSPSLHYQARQGAWSWNAGGQYYFGQNNYPFTVHNGVATEQRRRRNSDLQAWTLSGGMQWRNRRNGTLELQSRYYRNRQHLPGAVKLYVDDNDERMAEQEALAQLTYRQPVGARFHLMAAGKYTYNESRYTDPGLEYPGGCLRQNYWQHEAYMTAGFDYRPASWLLMAYATDVQQAWMTSNLKTDNDVWRTTWLHALSGRATWQRLSLTARVVASFIYNGNADASARARNARRITPWLMAGWQAVDQRDTRLNLRTYYKETFRAPTFTECYYYHYGSPQVKPERARQFGLGVTCHLRATKPLSVSFRADAFGGFITDRITAVPVTLNLWRTTNIGRVRSLGAEGELNLRYRMPSGQRLEWNTTYTLQDLTNAMPESRHLQLAYTPRHVAASGLSWLNPWANVALNAAFCGERWSSPEHYEGTRLKPYAELSASLWQQWQAGGICYGARLDVLNLTGTEYEIIKAYPMPRQQVKLTLSVKW